MPEGGTLPWKIQKLNLAPSLSYDSIHKLLVAPKGKSWNYDSIDKEWSLIEAIDRKSKAAAVVNVDALAIAEGVVAHFRTSTENSVNTNAQSSFEHYTQPSDIFQGICLKYKITPLGLRRANGGFTGYNLYLAPNPLIIPLSTNSILITSAEAIPINVKDNDNASGDEPLTRSEVVNIVRKECRNLSINEAKAYLMLNDWNLSEALENAKEHGF